MTRIIILLIAVIVLSSSFSFSSETGDKRKRYKINGSEIILSIDSVRVQKNSSTALSVPVRVKNFQKIGALTLKIKFDTLSLQFKNISNVSGIKDPLTSCRNGVFILAWFDVTGTTGISLGDGKLFDLNFTFTGEKSDISFMADQCDISDNNAVSQPAKYINGAVLLNTTSVEKSDKKTANYKLEQNFPNPFNPTTNISYSVPNAASVSLKVYNLIGQEIATLVDSFSQAGNYSVKFDASALPSGTYMYRMETGGYSMVKKMILAK